MPDERSFLRAHIERFLGRRPEPAEILQRLVGTASVGAACGNLQDSGAFPRSYDIDLDTKLLTVTGGKWTTYRRMAEDAIHRAAPLGGLPAVKCRTAELRLHGWIEALNEDLTENLQTANEWERVYGADLRALHRLAEEDPDLERLLHPQLPFRCSEVIWAARHEMATCVEDVLARRTRSLFLDARASLEAAPITAQLLARELGKDANWEQEQLENYRRVAEAYVWK